MSDATEAYRAAGVDLELGNDVSKMLYEAARQTWDDRSGRLGEMLEFGQGFSSFRAMPLDRLGMPGYVLGAGVDGVGTKIEAAERLQDHRTIAHDLIAMSTDDAVVRGAEPFAVATILDVKKLKDIPDLHELVGQLAVGYIEAARAADVTIINGETAELGDRVGGYGDFNYNWSSTALWMARRERIIDNSQITPGDALVGFREHGFRSNGLSLVRRILSATPDWHNRKTWPDTGSRRSWSSITLGELVLRPSIIYSKAVVAMFGGCDPERRPQAELHGAAHITGGGIPEKVGRMLRTTGNGAEITDPYYPPHAMRLVQAQHAKAGYGELSDEAAYQTWNMGQGMIVATPEPEAVIAVANEHGIQAKRVGVVSDRPGIRISSRAADEGRVLEFLPEA